MELLVSFERVSVGCIRTLVAPELLDQEFRGDPLRQVWVGVERSISLYYWKHITCMHIKEVTSYKG